MKRIAILFLFVTSLIYPQSYYLNIWSNGKVTSIPVSEISKLTFSSTTSVDSNEETKEQTLARTFELFQNYPNPFNPTTNIQYQISSSGLVEIQVFNITGELVKTLVSTNQSAGKYSVTWDGKDNTNTTVATGIYIYRVMHANSVLSKKMLLLK
jgi:hypothetical protein